MIQLNYKKYGGGEPLIVLHGFLGSLDNWHTLASEWGNNGFAVYTIDLRNHGRSPHTEHHNIPLMRDDLKDFMVQHRLSAAHILGHSMGGKVAMAFALTYPELTNRLIVADMAPRAYQRGHDEVLNAIQQVNLDQLQTRKEADEAMKPLLGDFGTRQFVLKSLDRDEQGQFKWKFNITTLARDYDEVIQAIRSDKPFTGPALFLKGALSLYVQEKDVPEIRALFPNARIQTIEGAGHWLHADQPQLFSAAVKTFLTSV